ncbi:MAG: T9SS type A sorting domain-containing protein [Bacteroidia bacterium]|nr:T9SS type A sorting domain-containing protein [Bacteroidia bacterium]
MKKQLQLIVLVLVLGILKSAAQLANWSSVPGGTNFPTNVSGQINGFSRICQMKFHPTNNNIYYAVTAQGGLFITNNQASSWTVAPGTETLNSSCAAICVDYTNTQNIWLGTGDPNYYSNGQGLMYSNNGGISFTQNSLTNCLVIEMLQNPLNSSEYIVATNKGIYKSTNGGTSWAATTSTALPFCDMKSNAAVNSQTLYATTNENVPKFLRSTDFGTSWTQITTGIVTSNTFVTGGARIAVTPANTNVVYFEVIGEGGIVHKSNNGGLSFNVKKPGGSPYITFYSNSNTSSSQGNYNNALTVDRTDPAKVWLQSHNTWFSADSGATWTMLTFWANIVHTDMHQLEQAPFDNTKLYSCNDGGVWLSTDGGNNWVAKSDGLYAYEIGNECGIGSLIKKDFVSIGTQDNGKLYSDQNGWFTIGGGDDYAKRQCDYNGNIYFDGLNRQQNHTGASVSYNLPTTNWNAFGFNRTNNNLGFMGFTDVYRTTNLSNASPTWTVISNFSLTIRAVHSCIANPNRLYVLVSSGALYVSNNALSANPTFSISNLPSSASNLGSIATMANNADIIYVSANNFIYRSANAGASWANVTFNLPNVNHRRILAEEYGGTQELVLVATNNAVYYKKAGQTSWTNYSTNLPSRRSPTGFSMFDNGTNQSRIRYASYGRAIWESGFDNLRVFGAQIIFNTDTTITCSTPSIQVADGSVGTTNTPITYTWNFPGGAPTAAFTPTANVSYSVTGTYSISLTIKDALNNVSTKTITRFIQVISCNADTIPGNALFVNGTSNYAKTGPISLGNTNSITISAWIKIDAVQPSFAGIVFSPNGTATGLNFRNGNQIGYHYNGLASTYNYAGGPTIPQNVWVHVALATSANSSTIYVNGVPYINNVANTPINFTSGFNLGNDRDNSSRTMSGMMDEVCFYNRTLNRDEIRELMHLTRNHNSIDPALKTYYQFNEVGNSIYDRATNVNAVLNGSSNHVLSTAPVGSGNSERQTINTPGLKVFTNEGVSINFPSAVIPNGEICVTRLNIQPDSVPTGKSFTNTAKKYWIINNYGSNGSFNAVSNMSLTGYGNITATQAGAPRKFKLYNRVTGGYLASSWNKIDSAYAATTATNALLSYSGSAVTYFNTQFTVSRDSCLPASIPTLSSLSNTLCVGSNMTLTAGGSINDGANWAWYSGSCGGTLLGTGNSIVVSPTANTVYFVRGEGGCAVTGSCTAKTLTVVTAPQSPSVILGTSTVCLGSSVVYSVSPVQGASSYSWSLPGGWSGTSVSNTISAIVNSTNGLLNVKSSNSCGASQNKSLTITVNTSVTASQSVNLCFGKTFTVANSTYSASGTYTNLLSRANGCDSLLTTTLNVDAAIDVSVFNSETVISAITPSATYQWIDCDKNPAIIAGATAQNFTPTANGNYAVIITINNCSDTSACVNFLTTDINKTLHSGEVKIYPNPGTDKVTIETTLNKGQIALCNTLGQQLMVVEIKSGKSQILELSEYANGIYFIKITSEDKLLIKKLIKQ